ncbi:lysophospholipid acyltransferase family protein [Stenoxybacter acetivorans]|uniref:lysophospholipid acyltransferase family protein n=1 Tax=Stenoxybacter acetivorans TaxID=422441 RepID=UPI0006895F73|nr:1-acyl-sn-glycerol-3-phosphate acyltransferase [Stenoxybacter acetivorans]
MFPRLCLASRLLCIGIHLWAGCLKIACLFPFLSERQRSEQVQKWSVILLRLCRVRLHLHHADNALHHGLYVCNHISWLDIFVINAWRPCAFVCKDDVKSWFIIGYLVSNTGNIFISRSNKKMAAAAMENISQRLKKYERIAFFPEGTSSDGSVLLPFKSYVFQAALDAGTPVQPLALRYLNHDKTLCRAAAYYGDMSLWQSLCALLRCPETEAHLSVLNPIDDTAENRRGLCERSYQAVSECLADTK